VNGSDRGLIKGLTGNSFVWSEENREKLYASRCSGRNSNPPPLLNTNQKLSKLNTLACRDTMTLVANYNLSEAHAL
jgi:hypothetical protein